MKERPIIFSGTMVRAISIRQPWAWLIIAGHKPVENRGWYTGYRGPLAIHAAKGMTRAEYEDAVCFVSHIAPEIVIPARADMVLGAVLGTVRQVGCVTDHPSPFFQGKYGHIYEVVQRFDVPCPARGALGFWDWVRT